MPAIDAGGNRLWLERGYSTSAVIRSLGTLGHLGRWMERDALAVDQLSDEGVSAFLASQVPGRGVEVRRSEPG
ncbi:MAG: hypothetical protein M3P44_10350 [Actinomycetota bacterium]|nr:hypothetical protein [Actinomycetota bacterium]